MIRFFTEPSEVCGDAIRLSPEDAAHVRSLRLRPSELFVVCDGAGNDYICRLAGSGGDGSVAAIADKRASIGEPSARCSVYIACAKGDRLDYAVQKAVELGAFEIVLFPSARCVAMPSDMGKKTARLRRIALETAKQSGRGRVPPVLAADSFNAAVSQAAKAELALFCYECEDKQTLKSALTRKPGALPASISVVTGPEGGFEPSEAEAAKAAGLVTVTLGPRILRCETAPVAVLAAIMFWLGEM